MRKSQERSWKERLSAIFKFSMILGAKRPKRGSLTKMLRLKGERKPYTSCRLGDQGRSRSGGSVLRGVFRGVCRGGEIKKIGWF